MHIGVQRKFGAEQMLLLMRGLIIGAALFSSCYWAINFFPSTSSLGEELQNSSTLKKIEVDYAKMGTGGLSLKTWRDNPLMSFLQRELKVIGKNSKPHHEEAFLIELQSTKMSKVVRKAEKFFLQIDTTQSPIQAQFSIEPTNIDAALFSVDDQSVHFSIHSSETQALVAAYPIVKQPSVGSVYFQQMQTAKWWGQDRLFANFGGAQYGSLQNKQRLEIGEGAQRIIYLVEEGDLFVWKVDRWISCNDLDQLDQLPVMKVCGINKNCLLVKVWDEQGFRVIDFPYQSERATPFSFQPEQFLTGLKLKTLSQVSCMIGKKRFVLKCGDWLIKNGEGWHNLKGLKEIEAYLAYQTPAELFIFEELSRKGNQWVLKGQVFDPMRINACKVEYKIAEKKSSAKQNKRKKIVL